MMMEIKELQSHIYKYEDFLKHLYKNILNNDDYKDHIPIPVFSYITTTINTSFMLRGMLSIGYFEKEIGITLQTNLLERIRYFHFIVPDEDKASLLKCTNKLTLRYIEEQVQYIIESIYLYITRRPQDRKRPPSDAHH